jgi:AcrR family transcriptional regulator
MAGDHDRPEPYDADVASSVTPLPASALVVPVSRWADSAAAGIRERSRRTRRRLLLAAADLFDEAGYHGASISDILAAAALTKGALYFHFRSKYALAEAMLAEVQQSWTVVTAEIADRGLDPLWRLLVETDAYVARWMYDPLVRGISRALDDPELVELRSEWMGRWERSTIERLTEAAAIDLLAPAVNPRRAGRAVVAVATGNYALAASPDDLWSRMTESWEGLLPIMAAPRWRSTWAASGWRSRARPEPGAYRVAREP